MRSGRSRSAGVVAAVAAQAVRGAAESSGVSLPDPDVTCVARSAAGIARGLVAGPEAEEPVAHLLGIWCPGPGDGSGGLASLSLVA
jgi:hypothetical protein